jgi:hypothetical protein
MSFWDGTQWVDETAVAASPKSSRRASWAATAVMVLGLAALIIPFGATSAASHKRGPDLYVGCTTSTCTVGGSLTVRGEGFTPSAGGQQVILWVGYPNDYCGTDGCHGFYFDPWVASDGTFSVTFNNATEQAGTGQVSATEYMVKQDKWWVVATANYVVY